jgi:hypothetical protein
MIISVTNKYKNVRRVPVSYFFFETGGEKYNNRENKTIVAYF